MFLTCIKYFSTCCKYYSNRYLNQWHSKGRILRVQTSPLGLFFNDIQKIYFTYSIALRNFFEMEHNSSPDLWWGNEGNPPQGTFLLVPTNNTEIKKTIIIN